MASSKSAIIISLLIPAIISLLIFPCNADNVLFSSEQLSGGQSLSWGSYIFIMQTDCNLVLYDSGSAVWSSQTFNKGSGCNLRMQSDGNLVVYDGSGKALWASGTARSQDHYVLVLQKDRNVVIYGGAIWATGTNRVGTADIIIMRNTTEPVAKASENIVMVTGEK